MVQLTGYDYFMQLALQYGWSVPAGGIIMWHGTIAAIPTGWALCDGNNSTPNLRDKFIVGAKQDDGGVTKTNVTGALTQSGGALGHTHTFTGDGHNHNFTGTGHQHGSGGTDYTDGSGSNPVWSGYASSASANAAGTIDAMAAAGTTDSENTLPPYYALAFIMKT